RKVDFKNTVLIMTSNLGARQIVGQKHMGFVRQSDEAQTGYTEMRARVMEELKRAFNPEFLNRIDDVIVFHQLSKEVMKSIVEILLVQLTARLAAQDIEIELSAEAKDLLLEKGFDPYLGARP